LVVGEQPGELVGSPQLGPGLTEQVVEELGRALPGRVVEQTLQGEMGGGAAGLLDRGRLRETVDSAELE
jgi:hypothetical protein